MVASAPITSQSTRPCPCDRMAGFTQALAAAAKSLVRHGYLDDKGVLKHDGAEAGDVGGEGLARQVGPGMDVQRDLHVVGPKVEALLRPRQHRLVVVVDQQLVLWRGQRRVLGPLLHIGHPWDQLQPAPRW